jgi:aminoglycoside phosphotransferase (APT) family kinase protein
MERLVVRKETPDPAIYPPQAPNLDVEVWIQYSIMRALTDHSRVPVAPLLGYEPDANVLGAPFFVMEFVDGDVPIENPIYTQSGFFADATPDERRSMIDDGLRVLAQVHAIDWDAAGLDWLIAPGTTPGTLTQLDVWERSAERELAGRVHPALARGLDWLRGHAPDPLPATLCWGDPRPGNMIWRNSRCVCVTDFEAASIAPAEVDLGWWLMFDRWSHEVMGGIDRLDGEPTRDEQRTIYSEYAGRDVGDTFYYEVFAAARYCVIVVRVMNRMVARGDMPADQTVWLENPATDCLLQLLDG